jgi:thymidylate synthase
MTELVEKKSRFISYAYRIENEAEIAAICDTLAREHKRSRHFVFAYKLGDIEKCDDNGEPRGTAGLPTLEAIRRRKLDNILVITVRYFGGILLGKGGLIRAYGKSAGKELDRCINSLT